MRHTIRAPRVALYVSLSFSCALVFGAAQEEQQVLDLTKQLIPKNHSLGLPGQFVGGTLAKRVEEEYELPVRLEIKRLFMSGESVELELRLTNSGESLLDVPSCLDGLKAFQSGTMNHRSMEFGLAVKSSSGVVSEPIEVTFGSSLPECSTYVQPGRSLLVIIKALYPEQILAMRKQSAHVAVRAFVAGARFEDDRYYVKQRSRRVESQPIEASF